MIMIISVDRKYRYYDDELIGGIYHGWKEMISCTLSLYGGFVFKW